MGVVDVLHNFTFKYLKSNSKIDLKNSIIYLTIKYGKRTDIDC